MSRSPVPLPVLAALAGVACLSLMDAFMKGASLAVGPYSATLLRAVIGTGLMVPVWLAAGVRRPPREAMKLHVERGVVSCFMALSFFYALTMLPIAETIAISFVAPLFTIYLARVLLRETIRPSAILGSLLGFAGTLVIVSGRLGRSDFDRDAMLGLGAILFSALLYSYNFIVMRRQSQVAPPAEIAFFHSLIPALVLLVAAPFAWTSTDIAALSATGIAALLTVVGAMTLAWAYARAEAQLLVPMEYSGFLWASLFGWLFFREAIAPPTIAGTLLIVAGCWIAARLGRPEPTAI